MDEVLSAIGVGCTSRKHVAADSFLSQSSLRSGVQASVAREWLQRLRNHPRVPVMPAADLYAGRGVSQAKVLAADIGANLFIISAGLGLLHGTMLVPAYNLTVSRVPGAIHERVDGPFSSSAWWSQVVGGCYSGEQAQFTAGTGRIVLALSQPYGRMLGPWLSELSADVRVRLRLLGANLEPELPPELARQWIRYDDRIDVAVPGMRLHYATRVLEHFVSVCAGRAMTDAADDQRRVDKALRDVAVPVRASRARVSDTDLLPMVQRAMKQCGSGIKALGHVRNVLGVACSDERFKRLVMEVQA